MTRHVLVIGAQRCGTTLLYELLDAHPDIAMARPRRPEPKVFLSDDLSGRSQEWYHATYFGHATTETVLGEKSTSYLEDPRAPARILRMLGPCDIVVQLRDPVSRAVSNWRFSHEQGVEERPLERALAETLGGSRAWDRNRTSVSPYAYLARGRFIDDLDAWFERFGPRLHVRFLEDSPGSPEQTASLYSALGVDPSFRPTDPVRRVNASLGEPPALDPGLLRQLRAYFAESDRRLAQRLDRRLPWPSL